jgi:hypothetical protein
MWSYYGAKTNVVDYYPKPDNGNIIIEPFAGTARYALKYFEHDVLLVDKWNVIIDLWHYLQQCSPKEVLQTPTFKTGQNIDDYVYEHPGQKLLAGFLMGYALTYPGRTGSPSIDKRPNRQKLTLKNIAGQLYKIKHWKVVCSSYEDILNQHATWFIDPPYQYGGGKYRHSNRNIDFSALSNWSKSRLGQVIVCENDKANWMDFKPMCTQQGIRGANNECIWTNNHTVYRNDQLLLFNNNFGKQNI